MENNIVMIAATTHATAAKATKACIAASVAKRAVPGSVPWSPPTC